MKKRHTHIFLKDPQGHYVEPAWVSARLFDVESFSPTIHDPACGFGTIVRTARAAGYESTGADIVDRRSWRFAFSKTDFLERTRPIIGNVVCNPPFDLVQQFAEHALELGADKVALICLVRRLNAARWLGTLPLQTVYLLTPRPSMPPGSYIRAGKKPGGGTQDFCWLLFESGYTGTPTLRWLHRDGGLNA